MSNNEGYYVIDIVTEDSRQSILDEMKALSNFSVKKQKIDDIESGSLVISEIATTKKEKPKKNKKKKKSLLIGAFDDEDEINEEGKTRQEIDEESLLDVDLIMRELEEEELDESIIGEQKKNYKKNKKDNNDFKKEFADELALLYNLLDETSKFGKGLEKDLSQLKGSKVRGVSKYTNDLTELILTSKQNKLNILKEITSVKKTIADLKMKAEAKDKQKDNGTNSPEYLASAYLRNILNHGRTDFISTISNNGIDPDNPSLLSSNDYIDEEDDDKYTKFMMDRLDSDENPYRSSEGSKYIEYENDDVKLHVKKCIDTGEWEFVALTKTGKQLYDYPLPSKRDAGRMKFSDDGNYATDAKGRMYNVIEYFLPDDD